MRSGQSLSPFRNKEQVDGFEFLTEMVYRYSLDGIFHERYFRAMRWEVEYTDEFGQWWVELS